MTMDKMPRNPRLPVPFLHVADDGSCYAWCCDKHGIRVYTNAKKDAQAEWLAAYLREYF
jgi:hypothetical protein